jgi:hypothetical protein
MSAKSAWVASLLVNLCGTKSRHLVWCIFPIVILTSCGNEHLIGRIDAHNNEEATLSATIPKNHTAWRMIFNTEPRTDYSRLIDKDTVVVYLENEDSVPLTFSGRASKGMIEISPHEKVIIYDGPLFQLIYAKPDTPVSMVFESSLERNVNVKLLFKFHLSGGKKYVLRVDRFYDLQGP